MLKKMFSWCHLSEDGHKRSHVAGFQQNVQMKQIHNVRKWSEQLGSREWLTVVVVAQLCEYTKNHCMVHFK